MDLLNLLPIMIEERNETDETECEQWECNNIYTRCNGIWNCLNGADEIDCNSYSTLNCSSNHHLCVSPDTNQLICLPIEKANDGKVDCLGATDEPTLCRTKYSINTMIYDFYCMNQTFPSCIILSSLCNGHKINVNMEMMNNFVFQIEYPSMILVFVCQITITSSNVEKFLCSYKTPTRQWKIIYFTLDRMIKPVESQMKKIENTVFPTSFNIEMSNQHQPRCHRGLDLRVWLNTEFNKQYMSLSTKLLW